jgi:hypothetical protein
MLYMRLAWHYYLPLQFVPYPEVLLSASINTLKSIDAAS